MRHYDFFDSLAGDQNYVSFTGMITYSNVEVKLWMPCRGFR